MDPKTLLIIWLVLAGFGSTVSNFMKIVGLTKTIVVEGGNKTRVVDILASSASTIGWLIFLLLIMFHGDIFIRAREFVFGG
jgi:hypothetical protein